MAINVYAWPPVKSIGRAWNLVQPVQVLRSAMTGKEQVQASQRARRYAEIEVPALYRYAEPQSGYMEMLAQLLQGGVHAVRLTSWRPSVPVPSQCEFAWLSGSYTATATTSAGFSAWQISGLPPGYPVLWPGDRFRVGVTLWQAVNKAVANEAGQAVVRVIGTTAGTGAVTFDQQESAVFRPDGIPSGVAQIGQASFTWSFREVFADEVGGFVEVDPWI